MNQNTGSRPLPPPPPSTLGRTNSNVAGEIPSKIQDGVKKTMAETRAETKAIRPKRSSGQPSLEYIIKKAYEQGYSDIHLGVEEVPRMRDRGEMVSY